ncbi:hypothetical protein FNV43_RR23287 [Rhamnella rubrinervis]|uniref:Uncharacterized protein n=1 Tax=Rhamnella rubrinervis TaxID=2594499 RepID=A0A8K0GVV8_9ROSA|nr:hypothetical protein FNV43_RR23287 [Rhamnella rubrinervis]
MESQEASRYWIEKATRNCDFRSPQLRHKHRENKKELSKKSSPEYVDLLSPLLSSGHSDEQFVTDIVISFILAGRAPRRPAALTWLFWLVAKNPRVEKEILKEINETSETSSAYNEVKTWLAALETDHDFLGHMLHSIQSGNEVIQFVREIAHQLQELRRPWIRFRCQSVPRL